MAQDANTETHAGVYITVAVDIGDGRTVAGVDVDGMRQIEIGAHAGKQDALPITGHCLTLLCLGQHFIGGLLEA